MGLFGCDGSAVQVGARSNFVRKKSLWDLLWIRWGILKRFECLFVCKGIFESSVSVPDSGDGGGALTYSVNNPPAGLSLDASTGIITGSLKAPLSTAVIIHAKNAKGEATRPFVIVGAAHALAAVPMLMGSDLTKMDEFTTNLMSNEVKLHAPK
jgi:hypothetical protein